MKTKTITLYSFNELDEDAKHTAINELRQDGNPWANDNYQSLKAFCKVFPCSIGRNGLSFHGDNLEGLKLASYIWRTYKKELYKPKQYWICNGTPNCVGLNAKHRDSKIFVTEDGCPLTGFWMDNEILKPIYDFVRKPDNRTDFESLINDCFSAYEIACQKDFDFQTSDEMTIENIEANEYTFTEDGKLEN